MLTFCFHVSRLPSERYRDENGDPVPLKLKVSRQQGEMTSLQRFQSLPVTCIMRFQASV